MSQDITALRAALFAQLAELRAADSADPDKLRGAIAKAGAVSDLAKTITDTARVQVEYLRHVGGDEKRSDFLEGKDEDKPLPPGITGITRHRLAG
jgi:hypothetical protein